MVYTSCCLVLHFKHPVKFVTSLIQDIRNSVSAFRNSPIIIFNLEIFISQHDICNSLSTGYDITSVVTGIMPSTCYILCNGSVIIYNSLIHVAFRMAKVTIYSYAAALSVKHHNYILICLSIWIISNNERITCSLICYHIVFSRFCKVREIKHLNIKICSFIVNVITYTTVKYCFISCGITYYKITDSNVVILNNGILLIIRLISQLINRNRYVVWKSANSLCI